MKRRAILQASVVATTAPMLNVYANDLPEPHRSASLWTLDDRPLHGDLASPVGMGFDPSGSLYVGNWSAGTVERFARSGERSIFAAQLNGPSGLAIGPSGDIFVASYSDDLVWQLTPRGQRTVFVRGLATPAGLSFDLRGRLLVANRRTHQILAIHPDGNIDAVAEGLQTPVGAVELADGRLMVSNIAGGVSLVGKDKRARTVNSELRSPGPGIVRASADAVFVVDYGGSTISHIDVNGARVIVADGLSSPSGLALAPDGSLLVGAWSTQAVHRVRPL